MPTSPVDELVGRVNDLEAAVAQLEQVLSAQTDQNKKLEIRLKKLSRGLHPR